MRAKAAPGRVRGSGSRAKAAGELRRPGTMSGKKTATGQLWRTTYAAMGPLQCQLDRRSTGIESRSWWDPWRDRRRRDPGRNMGWCQWDPRRSKGWCRRDPKQDRTRCWRDPRWNRYRRDHQQERTASWQDPRWNRCRRDSHRCCRDRCSRRNKGWCRQDPRSSTC